MIIKPDDQQTLRDRARRYVRGIAVAVTLTFAALLFFYATLYGETSEGAVTQSEASTAVPALHAPQETGSISAPSASTVH
jgi:hypothetical protein